MGVDTRAYLRGAVLPEEIAKFLAQKYNLNLNDIKIDDKTYDYIKFTETLNPLKIYDSHKDVWVTQHCTINFKTPQGEMRSLFWYFSNAIFTSELAFLRERKEPIVLISLRYNEESIQIIKDITTYFGGWIDENDCDDIGYYELSNKTHKTGGSGDFTPPKKSVMTGKNKEIKPTFYFTVQDLCDHFDANVVIVSQKEKEELLGMTTLE